MTTLSDFTIATPRPLPVIVLADISGSMSENGKIDSLNHALDEMIKSFATEAQDRAEIQVSVITFGKAGAQIHSELTPASKAAWSPMQADGGTPLGAAISLATSLVEDRQRIPGRAYRPAIVLVSDGQPTDEWKEPVKRLLASERGSRADRFALGIGDDADKAMLAAFLGDPAKAVLQASDARQVQTFFRWVTMSVTSRSRSATPNAAPIQPPPISHATPSDGSCRLARPRVRTIGASIPGPRHVREGRANQDAWASCRLPQGVVLVVSDGVGSCRYAEIGSRAACRAVRDAVQLMKPETPPTELTERITAAWNSRLERRNPTECASTCLFSVRTHGGRLLVGGLGDGLAVVTSSDGTTEPRVIPLRGGEFGETVALGDGRESRGWVVEEFDDRAGQLRTLLASDGVSQDLSQDRLQAFHDWLIATFGKLSTRRWRASLRRQLQAWPTPGATDDRTLAVMWTGGEVAT